MSKNQYKNVPLWKLAIRLGLVFILILVIIKFFWNWIKVGDLSFIKQSFDNGKWIGFVISHIFGGLIYGLIVGYFLKKQKE